MLAHRTTKYTDSIMEIMDSLGHATNDQILKRLRGQYPELSATTVHRATTRLKMRGLLSCAPSDSRGSIRYDFNNLPHDHFICNGCDGIKDISVAEGLKPIIEQSLDGCRINGRLTISGQCNKCIEGTKE